MEHAEIERIVLSTLEKHGGHTAILYGSQARGDATSESDIDFLCVREDGASARDTGVVNGLYVDAFIYPESKLTTLEPALLRVLGGIVLRERDGYGTALLARLQELHDRGPTPMPDDERRALVLWSRKMLERFRGKSSLDAAYRRMVLLPQSLEDYFSLRGAWFRGSKPAFAWLLQHDGLAYAAFARAAQPGASDEAFSELVEIVYGPREP